MTQRIINQSKFSSSVININFSYHALQRIAQRGINKTHINLVVNYGRITHKQGFRFYFLTGKELRFFPPKQADRLKNLVVVLARDANVVVTVYKDAKAPNKIRHKSKRLIKN
jgi:hypothetical protein